MASSGSPKRLLFRQFAEVAKAVAHEHRLELLEALAQGERSVETLADCTGLSIANASQHLQRMRRAGLVETRRDGKFVYYCLSGAGCARSRCGAHPHRREPRRRGRHDRAHLFRQPRRHGACVARRAPGAHAEGRRPGSGRATGGRVRDGAYSGRRQYPTRQLEAKARHCSTRPRRSSPTAAARGASCRSKPFPCSGAKGFRVRRLEDGLPEWKAAELARRHRLITLDTANA